jgi:DNA helicase-2/ATP-dependent DNA helicase PcrA
VRAASELRLRLADVLGETAARQLTAATFHWVCARLLREHAQCFGRTERYTIYDGADMRRVIDWLLSRSAKSAIGQAVARHGQPAAKEVLAEISRARNRLLEPDSYEQAAAHPAGGLIAALWREAERELRRCDAFTFDDLLAYAVRLLAEQPHRLTWLRQRWRWIVVDEFQDVSHAQAMLVDPLAGPAGNLCVCGDDDQVVHSWRSADVAHMLEFADRHPGCRRVVLARNFRCRAEILGAAALSVAHNERRTAKTLIAVRGAGGHVDVVTLADEREEGRFIACEIATALADGIAPSEVLALARTGYASVPLQRALAQAGIPHRVLGSLGL